MVLTRRHILTKSLDDSLFDTDKSLEESPEVEWRGMPEFNQPDNAAFRQIIISFDDQAGIDQFEALLGANITAKTKSLWFPHRDKNNVVDLFYFDADDTDE